MRRLILASASPRRRELLAQAGFKFEVRPADVNEDPLPGEDPINYVVRLARDKAQAVFNELSKMGAPGGKRRVTISWRSRWCTTSAAVPAERRRSGRPVAKLRPCGSCKMSIPGFPIEFKGAVAVRYRI